MKFRRKRITETMVVLFSWVWNTISTYRVDVGKVELFYLHWKGDEADPRYVLEYTLLSTVEKVPCKLSHDRILVVLE